MAPEESKMISEFFMRIRSPESFRETRRIGIVFIPSREDRINGIMETCALATSANTMGNREPGSNS